MSLKQLNGLVKQSRMMGLGVHSFKLGGTNMQENKLFFLKKILFRFFLFCKQFIFLFYVSLGDTLKH